MVLDLDIWLATAKTEIASLKATIEKNDMLHRKYREAMKRRIAVLDEDASRSVAALAESREELEEVERDHGRFCQKVTLGAAREGVLAKNSRVQ